jgi:hypothetical protein
MTKSQERMLVCSGKMADIAGAIVGESLYSPSSRGMPTMMLVEYLDALKNAVREYNRAVLDAVKK